MRLVTSMPQSGGTAPAEEIASCLCQRVYQTHVAAALSPGAPGLWENDTAELCSTVTIGSSSYRGLSVPLTVLLLLCVQEWQKTLPFIVCLVCLDETVRALGSSAGLSLWTAPVRVTLPVWLGEAHMVGTSCT